MSFQPSNTKYTRSNRKGKEKIDKNKENGCNGTDCEQRYKNNDKKYSYIALTLSDVIVHHQLEALSSSNYPDSVPLVVIEFLSSIKSFRSLAWGW